MELNYFAHRLKKLVERNSLENQFEFYLFGSFAKGQHYIDIDVLILYSDHKKLGFLKAEINKEFLDYLIHLTCLTNREQIELNFINITNAKRLNYKEQ